MNIVPKIVLQYTVVSSILTYCLEVQSSRKPSEVCQALHNIAVLIKERDGQCALHKYPLSVVFDAITPQYVRCWVSVHLSKKETLIHIDMFCSRAVL